MSPKVVSLAACLTLASTGARAQEEGALDPERVANTIILDESGVQNLRIETVVAEEQDFESTVFAIGRIEDIPSRHSVLSSRIPGRVVHLNVFEGDLVEEGQVLARVESRRPGNPPPTIDLKAPQSGIVIASHVRLGEPVEPENELLDIADRSVMWAIAQVPENDAPKIAPGSQARIRIPALGAESQLVTLIRYGVQADREAGTIAAIFELPNPDRKLMPGMRAEFSLIVESRSDVLAVPRDAVQGSATNRVVFVKDFELPNAFIRSPVVLGEQNEQFVEVISGIFPGDEVVTRGSYSLSFAGGGSGMSLKEALDAAHGHEHNEDGSEITPEQKAAQQATEVHQHDDHQAHSATNRYLQIYAAIVTLLLLILAQLLWNNHRKQAPNNPITQ